MDQGSNRISTMCKVMEDYARESNIQSFIDASKIYCDTVEGAIQKIMAKFGLTREDAAQKVAKYWDI